MIKMSAGRKTFIVFNTALLCLLSFLFIAPYLHIFAKALNEASDTALGKVGLWPNKWTFDNMMVILIDETTWYGFAVTVSRVVIGSALALIVTYFAAYALLRKNLRFRKFIVAFLTVPMFFGGGLIATYVTYANLHILNTFWVYIIPNLISVYNMVLVKTYIESLPASLEESAQIDGAGYFRRFAVIVLPLCVPILATIALYSAVGHWNNFMDCLLYIQSPKLYTLQYILNMYFRQAAQLAQQIANGTVSADESALNALTPTSVKLTVTVVITVPILLVYPFVQRYFVKGIMVGAVKG